jgi:hypothetical protein
MLHKVLSGLQHTTFPPLKKFPQLVLRRDVRLTLGISVKDVVPASDDAQSLLSASTREDQAACPIVELRAGDDRRLLGLGFLDVAHGAVSCFHITHPSTMLPVVNDAFFTEKLKASFERRRQLLSQETTAYRAVHGIQDLLPSIEVDHYCASFARICCDSAVGERIMSIAVEFLRDRGAEELIIESPQIPIQRITLTKPTISGMKNFYQEEGIQYLWQPPIEEPVTPTLDRWHLNLAFRRARLMIRDISEGKRVLCVNDAAAGMTLNACIGVAKHIFVVEDDSACRNWIRQIVTFNHGPKLIGSLVSLYSSLDSLMDSGERGGSRPRSAPSTLFDVVTMEYNAAVGYSLGDKMHRVVQAIAPRGLLVVQCSGTTVEASALVTSVSDASVSQGRTAWVVNRLSSTSLDFPLHALSVAQLSSEHRVHHTVFTFVVE